ncbi:MAG: hypothetical protein ABL933_18960 [Methyloglobulus sp.]|nr:hypothetical protein [Methyloglobulus sp.]
MTKDIEKEFNEFVAATNNRIRKIEKYLWPDDVIDNPVFPSGPDPSPVSVLLEDILKNLKQADKYATKKDLEKLHEEIYEKTVEIDRMFKQLNQLYTNLASQYSPMVR